MTDASPRARRALVLWSGGLDSTTALALARRDGFVPIALIFRYGQRHDVEVARALDVAAETGLEHRLIEVDLRSVGGSALTAEDVELPRDRDATDMATGGVPATYVPARNTILLSYALAWAETLDADDIFIGVNAIDYSGYPDCREEFIRAFETLANLACRSTTETGRRIRVHTPLIAKTKAEIIRCGLALGVDYARTWSCYDPVPVESGEPLACGRCDSCLLRRRGFAEAGVADPVPYALPPGG